MYNVGAKIIHSDHLISTVAYKLGPKVPPVYALEGSIAMAGGAITWLQNQLHLFRKPEETQWMAAKPRTENGESDNGGDLVFVPAFNGLFAPYWRSDARGLIIGINQFTTKEQLIRAALEATCFQTKEILQTMQTKSRYELSSLLVGKFPSAKDEKYSFLNSFNSFVTDGAMSQNDLLMQMQADLLGIPVSEVKLYPRLTYIASFLGFEAVNAGNYCSGSSSCRYVQSCVTSRVTRMQTERGG